MKNKNLVELFEFKENTQKPIVVFFHGFNATHKFVMPLMEQERSFAIYSFDFPGNGNSAIAQKASIEGYGEVAAKFLNQFNHPVTVVAHSLGGAIVAQIANHKNIKEIILIAPVNPYMAETVRNVKELPLMRNKKDETIRRAKIIIANKKKKTYLKHVGIAAINYIAHSKLRNEYIADMINNQMLNPDYLMGPLYEKYKLNTKPTFIIQGNDDSFVPPMTSKKIAKELNWVYYNLIETGHSPFSERPEKSLKLIESIINRK